MLVHGVGASICSWAIFRGEYNVYVSTWLGPSLGLPSAWFCSCTACIIITIVLILSPPDYFNITIAGPTEATNSHGLQSSAVIIVRLFLLGVNYIRESIYHCYLPFWSSTDYNKNRFYYLGILFQIMHVSRYGLYWLQYLWNTGTVRPKLPMWTVAWTYWVWKHVTWANRSWRRFVLERYMADHRVRFRTPSHPNHPII